MEGSLAYANAPLCHYCNTPAQFHRTSSHLYGGRNYGPVWQCPSCTDCYVGCHQDSRTPKGTPANAKDRALRKAAHAVFDYRWKGANYNRRMRGDSYQWLAEKMGLSLDECHIAQLHGKDLRKLINVCLDDMLGEAEPEPPSPEVSINPERIRQVIDEIKNSMSY